MVDLGYQDTEWVSGSDKNVLDAILWRNSLILATSIIDKGKGGYLRFISGWFRAPEGEP